MYSDSSSASFCGTGAEIPSHQRPSDWQCKVMLSWHEAYKEGGFQLLDCCRNKWLPSRQMLGEQINTICGRDATHYNSKENVCEAIEEARAAVAAAQWPLSLLNMRRAHAAKGSTFDPTVRTPFWFDLACAELVLGSSETCDQQTRANPKAADEDAGSLYALSAVLRLPFSMHSLQRLELPGMRLIDGSLHALADSLTARLHTAKRRRAALLDERREREGEARGQGEERVQDPLTDDMPLPSLRVLNLANNCLADGGVCALMGVLHSYPEALGALEELDLSANSMTARAVTEQDDVGTCSLLCALAKAKRLPKLKVLQLSSNQQCAKDEMERLVEAFEKDRSDDHIRVAV